ncbi:MAG: Pr6Pr family membrane protein [Candidatus Pedobacter colombiensis]|uniref:Pr6Pr family membrane protein n=1 Tax=Candidatus Pedobacter colombiensis TaxID=3121371 RepID=A0AAJ5W7K0_9SPHI|nr:Pr6Pr family membrane protein [Pedobacter sp.]WEK18419.1 MAG: Pr6Pr family membrane protein [Pedobacter sp.]
MDKKYANANKLFLITGTFLGWFALITQLYLIIANNEVPALESVTRYFSYFTILTNIMVVLCFTLLLLNFSKKEESFFSKPKVLAGVAVYISVVGIVYNLILRFTWQPKGLQLVVDELLHAIIPVLFVVYWLIFAPKRALKWADAFAWLIYPFVYLIFVLARGELSAYYPYPFVDVGALGYSKVILNSFYLLIVFLVLSLSIVGLGKLIAGDKNKLRS